MKHLVAIKRVDAGTYTTECSCGWHCPHGGHMGQSGAGQCKRGHLVHGIARPQAHLKARARVQQP